LSTFGIIPLKRLQHFNLSHSGDLALYAFAYNRHVGVDVEYIRANIDYEELAQYHFSPLKNAQVLNAQKQLSRDPNRSSPCSTAFPLPFGS